jgi:hypothetical protein
MIVASCSNQHRQVPVKGMALVVGPKRLEFEQGPLMSDQFMPSIAIMVSCLWKIRASELLNLKTMTCNPPPPFLALLHAQFLLSTLSQWLV